MARSRALEKTLGRIFNSPVGRKPDTQRKQREQAKALAAKHGIEIERIPEGGMNVWPPAAIPDASDPYASDHYASDWADALGMVEGYAKLLSPAMA